MSELKRKKISFQRRRNRSKLNIIRQDDRYRMCVYRSNRHIEVQIINDISGITLCSASSNNQSLKKELSSVKTKTEVAEIVGKSIAEKAVKLKISKVFLDRNGFPYHGRVKVLAENARKGGLIF